MMVVGGNHPGHVSYADSATLVTQGDAQRLLDSGKKHAIDVLIGEIYFGIGAWSAQG